MQSKFVFFLSQLTMVLHLQMSEERQRLLAMGAIGGFQRATMRVPFPKPTKARKTLNSLFGKKGSVSLKAAAKSVSAMLDLNKMTPSGRRRFRQKEKVV